MVQSVPVPSNISHIRQTLRRQLPLLMERYHVTSLGLFGSYVRGEEREDSDLDVLITFSETPSLLTFIELENHLSDVLGVQVDLVMKDALKPRIGQRVLDELVAV